MAEVYTYLTLADTVTGVTAVYFDEKTQAVKPVKYAQQAQNIEAVMELTMRYLHQAKIENGSGRNVAAQSTEIEHEPQ